MPSILCTPWITVNGNSKGSFEELTTQTFTTLLNELSKQGFTQHNIVKVRAKLAHLREDFSLYNKAYTAFFTTKPLPARATIGYNLPDNCSLSIQCLATKDKIASLHSENAPEAIGPYSQAIKAGNTLYISGQIPIDLISKKIESEIFLDQLTTIFSHVQGILNAGNSDRDMVFESIVYITREEDFETAKKLVSLQFPKSSVEIKLALQLPASAIVEIECLATCYSFFAS